jgi:hypothetical protein
MLWQSLGLASQADTQPIAYFLADSGTAIAVDFNFIPNSWVGHEIFRLAAIRTDKARLKLRAITMQARGAEVGPSLLGTAAIDGMNNEPAALLEGDDRPSSFDLRGESREYEHGRRNEGRNCDGREQFDHLVPNSRDDCCALNNGALLAPLR